MTTDTLDFPTIEAPPPAVVSTALALITKPATTAVATVAPSIKDAVLAQFKDAEAGMLALAEKYRAVAFDCKTTKGMADAVAARADLRDNGRLALTKAEKRVKSDVNDLKKVMGDEVDRLVAIVKPVEDAIDTQIKAEEQRKADAKAERERIESERIAKHRAGIAKIGAYLTRCQEPGMSADRISIGIGMLEGVTFGPDWQEFAVPAVDEQGKTLEAMRALHAAAVEREAEAARLESQRIENERVAAENAAAKKLLDEQLAALALAQKKAADDIARRARLEAEIQEIHAAATGHEHAPADDLALAIADVIKLDVSEAKWGEYTALAMSAQDMTCTALENLRTAAVEREEAARIDKAAAANTELVPAAGPVVATPEGDRGPAEITGNPPFDYSKGEPEAVEAPAKAAPAGPTPAALAALQTLASTITVGKINERFNGVLTIHAEGLKALGFVKQARPGPGAHFLQSDWPAICAALAAYITTKEKN